jgi:hypothetical protein
MIQENPMKRILATAGIAGIALVGVTAPANAGGNGTNDDKKVTICHATGSESNPYVQITVSENSLNGNGHALHAGDLIPAPAAGCPEGGHGGGGGGGGDEDSDHGTEMITICHATGSESNPYVEITIPKKAWWHAHKDHGDIYPVPAGGCCPEGEGEGGGGEEEETPPVVTPPEVTPPVVTPPEVTPPVVTPPEVTPPAVVPPAVVPPAVTPAPSGAAAAPVEAAAAVVPVVNRGFNAQTAAGSQPDGMPAWFAGLAALLGATGLIALRQRGRLQAGSK